MKSLFAFGLPVVALLTSAFPAVAQVGSQHPLGGVYTSPYSNRPVIGTRPAPGSGSGYRGRSTGSVYAAPYAYSFYVPGYFDNSGYGYGYQDNSYPPVQPVAPPPVVVPPAPPVVINQYFGTPPPQYQGQAAAQGAPASDAQQPVPPDHHYLLAYKNHTVYSVLTYWIEDKTMNYVTEGNKHNQASLDLIDMDLTKTLNEGR